MKFRSRGYLHRWRVGGKVIRVSTANKKRKSCKEREICRGTPPVFSWIMIKHVKKRIIHRALDRLLRNAVCQMWGRISPNLQTALFLKRNIWKDKLFPSNLTVSLKKKHSRIFTGIKNYPVFSKVKFSV